MQYKKQGCFQHHTLLFDYAGFSHRGMIRPVNEDNFLVLPDHATFCVADGAGGLEAGDLASHLALETIASTLKENGSGGEDKQLLNRAIDAANHSVFDTAGKKRMATTLVTGMADAQMIHLFHVGDSRAYLWRKNELQQKTEDHSLVAELYQEGKISFEEIQNHPRRNVITRAIGAAETVQIESQAFDHADQDVVLLCSDGLTTMLDEDKISEIMRESGPELDETAQQLVNTANACGGRDNITVLLFRLRSHAATT